MAWSPLSRDSLFEAVADSHVIYSVLLVTVAILCYFSNVRYRTPLVEIPGPFVASLSRVWKVLKILGARQELVMIDLHKKHGE